MDALVIKGPATFRGKVLVSGSKNTALPFLFASLLFDDEVRFKNVPRLWDIETTLKILQAMGAQSEWDKEAGQLSLWPKIRHKVAAYEWVRRMRAGILALGPLLAKYGEARVSLPGGCAIGARPVNLHIDAIRKMGVGVEVESGYIRAQIPSRLTGARISFPQVTVTGTENVLVLAAYAEGITRIENAAREPEVVSLGELLIKAGAVMHGLGTSTIEVAGSKLKTPPSPLIIPPDRIEAGTWISIAVATGSELTIANCDPSKMVAVIDAYRDLGAHIDTSFDGTTIKVEPSGAYTPIEIETAPYPGFATDMQAQILTNMCLVPGVSRIREKIFENRFMHVAELRRLGAKIMVRGNLATVEGPNRFQGAPIMATDLRASACLVVAALAATGETKISRIYHLDRGYQRLDEKLRRLGANVVRVSDRIGAA